MYTFIALSRFQSLLWTIFLWIYGRSLFFIFNYKNPNLASNRAKIGVDDSRVPFVFHSSLLFIETLSFSLHGHFTTFLHCSLLSQVILSSFSIKMKLCNAANLCGRGLSSYFRKEIKKGSIYLFHLEEGINFAHKIMLTCKVSIFLSTLLILEILENI